MVKCLWEQGKQYPVVLNLPINRSIPTSPQAGNGSQAHQEACGQMSKPWQVALPMKLQFVKQTNLFF